METRADCATALKNIGRHRYCIRSPKNSTAIIDNASTYQPGVVDLGLDGVYELLRLSQWAARLKGFNFILLRIKVENNIAKINTEPLK